MTAQVNVRTATPGDRKAFVRLRTVMFAAMGVPDVDQLGWQREAGAWFEARCTAPEVEVVVVDVDGTVVACAMGEVVERAPSPSVPSGRSVIVSNVCTLPEHRGHGYASRALEELMSWVRAESGAGAASLFATAQGRGMYERLGFREHAYPEMRLRLT